MNDLIQIVKILDDEELSIINNYADTLSFSQSTLFSNNEKTKIDNSVRSSLGSSMNEEHEVTKLIHEKINESLLRYKEKIIKINSMFQYYPVPGGYGTSSLGTTQSYTYSTSG